MVGKTAFGRDRENLFDIMALNGDELRHMEMPSTAQYLLIDLSNVKGRQSGFNEMMKVAMNAAVNAVLATLIPKASAAGSAAVLPPQAADHTEEASQARRQARSQRNAERREQLNADILSDSNWLTARDLSEKAGLQSVNPSAGPNRWKASGRIFAVPLNGKDHYPEYALDEGYRPRAVMKQVLALLGERKTPWGLAIWFGSANGWLGGNKPKDVLSSMPKQVLLAAQAEAEGGIHG